MNDFDDSLIQFANFLPRAIPRDNDRWRRGWVVRSERPVSADTDMLNLSKELERRAQEKMRQRLAENFGVVLNEKDCPTVEAIRVDARHIILWIETEDPQKSGGLTLEGQVEVLYAFDEMLGVEELQGMPKRYWIFFVT